MDEAGTRLRDAMTAAMAASGRSIQGTARASGFTGASIFYTWWNGKRRPTRASLERVARVLGIDPDELLRAYGIEPAAHYADVVVSSADGGVVAVEVKNLRAEITRLGEELAGERRAREAWERAWADRLGALAGGQDATPQDEPASPPRGRAPR